MEIEFCYKPQGDTLRAFHWSEESRRIMIGPLGSGKTAACIAELWRLAKSQAPDADGIRPTRFAAVRNTYSDLKTTTVPDFREIIDDAWGSFVWGPPPSMRVRVVLPDGTKVDCEVLFIALDRPDDVRKLRGLQLTGAWLNEVKELPKSVLDMLDLRVGRYPRKTRVAPTRFGLIGDSNAPDEDHWLYAMAEEDKPDGWAFFRQPGGVIRRNRDSPFRLNQNAENLPNLPDNYYSRAMQGKSVDWIAVNLANEYGVVFDGRPVYPEYNDAAHCEDCEPVEGLPIAVGIDFGLTPAAVFGQRFPNGRILWFDELATEHMGVQRFSSELKTKIAALYPSFAIDFVVGDPAGDTESQTDEQTCFQILNANGVNARPAATNDWTIRREAVANPLSQLIDGKPRLVVSPKCKITRKGMRGGYEYRRVQVSGAERHADKPNKNRYSHPCEAGQYLMLGYGEGRRVMASQNRAFKQGTVVVKTDFSVFG